MTIDQQLLCYKRLPNWTATTLPEMVTQKHNTKVGTWAKLTILSGSLHFYELDEEGEVTAEHLFTSETEIPFVEPQAWHRIAAASDDLECYLSFYCKPEDYMAKKYDTKAHSEVLEAVQSGHIKPGRALDLGCGHGRNALYLASLGHDVTAVDVNNEATQRIQMIADEENYNVRAGYYDINAAALPESETFDFILSTVVFMFLDPDQIPAIIKNMQERTVIGGYNLIVCAMDTEEHPCTMPFPFTFEEGELKNYYSDWELIKYNENLGHLHRLDEHGNPIALQFATMLAKKVK